MLNLKELDKKFDKILKKFNKEKINLWLNKTIKNKSKN